MARGTRLWTALADNSRQRSQGAIDGSSIRKYRSHIRLQDDDLTSRRLSCMRLLGSTAHGSAAAGSAQSHVDNDTSQLKTAVGKRVIAIE